jgi:hypothetical protein
METFQVSNVTFLIDAFIYYLCIYLLLMHLFIIYIYCIIYDPLLSFPFFYRIEDIY